MANVYYETKTIDFYTHREAEDMLKKIKKIKYPKLKDYQIYDEDGVVILRITREYNHNSFWYFWECWKQSRRHKKEEKERKKSKSKIEK